MLTNAPIASGDWFAAKSQFAAVVPAALPEVLALGTRTAIEIGRINDRHSFFYKL